MHLLCDWFSASQQHPDTIERFEQNVFVTIDGESGELVRQSSTPRLLSGSFNTSIQIKSNGNRVSLSGNIGRFGRPDNVFGVGVDECKVLANQLLESIGLPPFTKGDDVYLQSKTGKATKTYTGAQVSRVDMTSNWAAGENAPDFMHWLGSQKLGRTKVAAWGDGETVYWGKHTKGKTDGKWITSKAYLKGEEIAVRIKEKRRRKNLNEKHCQYLEKLSRWCKQSGIVRHETTFAERYLNQNNLKAWDRCTTHALKKAYESQLGIMMKRAKTRDLSQVPQKVKATYHDYINGVNVRTRMSKTTFYTHRNLLLEFGVDIAMPCKVRTLHVKPRFIDISPAVMPDFYQLKRAA